MTLELKQISVEEQEQIAQDQTHELVFPFEDQIFTLRVDTALLRTDLYNEAVAQGVDLQIVQATIENYYSIIGRENIIKVLTGRQPKKNEVPSESAAVLKTDLSEYILVMDWYDVLRDITSEKKLNARISLKSMVPVVDILSVASKITRGRISSIQLLYPFDQIPKQLRGLFLQQILDALWRHERQHIIQGMKGELERYSKSYRILKRMEVILTATFLGSFIGLSCNTLTFTAAGNSVLPVGLQAAFILAMPISYYSSKVLGKLQHLFSGHEIEAFEVMKEQHNQANKPLFLVSTESADRSLDPNNWLDTP